MAFQNIIEKLSALFGQQSSKPELPSTTAVSQGAWLDQLTDRCVQRGGQPLTPEDIHPGQALNVTRIDQKKSSDTGVTPSSRRGKI